MATLRATSRARHRRESATASIATGSRNAGTGGSTNSHRIRSQRSCHGHAGALCG
jgi:hypothetical protein